MNDSKLVVGEPELVGEIPPREELPAGTILGPDGKPLEIIPVEVKPVGWSCYEERGGPIYRIPDSVKDEEISLENLDSLLSRESMITTEHGLREGQRVLVGTLMGWSIATIKGDSAYSGEHTFHMLEWREDYGWYRNNEDKIACWTCTGSANTRGLKKLKLFGDAAKSEEEGFPVVEGIEEIMG